VGISSVLLNVDVTFKSPNVLLSVVDFVVVSEVVAVVGMVSVVAVIMEIVVVVVVTLDSKLDEVVKSGVDEVDVAADDDDDEFDEFGERKVVLILLPSPLPPLPNIIITGVRVEIKNTTKKRQTIKKRNFFAFILLIEFEK
jgi:hypothetical protein